MSILWEITRLDELHGSSFLFGENPTERESAVALQIVKKLDRKFSHCKVRVVEKLDAIPVLDIVIEVYRGEWYSIQYTVFADESAHSISELIAEVIAHG
jgi:hypothetical protein